MAAGLGALRDDDGGTGWAMRPAAGTAAFLRVVLDSGAVVQVPSWREVVREAVPSLADVAQNEAFGRVDTFDAMHPLLLRRGRC